MWVKSILTMVGISLMSVLRHHVQKYSRPFPSYSIHHCTGEPGNKAGMEKSWLSISSCLYFKGPKTASPLLEQRRSLNVDNLFTELHSVKSEWQKLGEVLGLDEDRLDEIFTINESEDECLRVMLEVWFQKSWKPTWRDVANALVAIGEDQLPERLYLMCKIRVAIS